MDSASDYLDEYADTTLEQKKSEKEGTKKLIAERYLPLFCARADEADEDTTMTERWQAYDTVEKKMAMGYYVLGKMRELYSAHRSDYGETTEEPLLVNV